MTVREYIEQRFQSFGVQLSEADLLDMSLSSGISEDNEMTADILTSIHVSMARFIPSMLARATSIGESGFSMSWNIQGIKDYYSHLCKKYGLEDMLNTDKPKVRFL